MTTADKGPASQVCASALQAKWRWAEQYANEIAWALCRELKADATDREREALAEAIQEFLK